MKRHPRYPRVLTVVLTALVTLFGFALPAPAILNGYWAYEVFEGSLNIISFQRCSLTSAVTTAAQWSDTNNLEALEMTTAIFTCNSGSPELREINVFDADYGDTGWVGLWTCTQPVAHMGVTACESGRVQIHTDYVNAAHSIAYNRSVLCHEHGHAVGLAHNSVSCMKSAPDGNNTTYSAAEKTELNNIY